MDKLPFILIHIGDKFFPDYAPDAVRQILTWNPDSPVFFICERQFFSNFATITAPNFYVVDINQIPPTPQHEKFNTNTRLDTSFRNGFWRFTTERLYILYDFMKNESINECIHIENDNTIYFSTSDPEFAVSWTETNGLSAPRHGARSLTFGILFCKSLDTLATLCDMLASTPTNRNEMDLGYAFFDKFPLTTSLLKSAPSSAALRVANGEAQLVAKRKDAFVYDAACYGQYLGGIDPRNGPSAPGFVNQDSFFNVSATGISYMWKRDEQGRRYPIIRNCTDGSEIRIANLHIHSKNLVPFLSDIGQIEKGELYQVECDEWFGRDEDFVYNPAIRPYIAGKRGNRTPTRVFVYAHRLHEFNPANYDSSFILVTHNSDENIDERFDHIFDHPNITKVYSQNLLTRHPKCQFIPIGQSNSQWPYGNTNALLSVVRIKDSIPKVNHIYYNCSMSTNRSARSECDEAMIRKGVFVAPTLNYPEYIALLVTYKYAICPIGNGIDTHRFWECIYLGVTPIVVRNPLITHIESAGYKMIVLNDWNDLDVSSIP
jgi:hypothetical protein